MTIMELGAIGEFVGAIGVIATLIYLALQIRHNTRSMEEIVAWRWRRPIRCALMRCRTCW